MQAVGKFLIVIGLLLVLGGVILYFGKPWRLPGDIVIERPPFTIYILLGTSLVLSLLLSGVLYLLSRLR